MSGALNLSSLGRAALFSAGALTEPAVPSRAILPPSGRGIFGPRLPALAASSARPSLSPVHHPGGEGSGAGQELGARVRGGAPAIVAKVVRINPVC